MTPFAAALLVRGGGGICLFILPLKTLKNPVIAFENTVYVPLSFLNDSFGIEVNKTENGLYVIGGSATSMDNYSHYFE